MTDDRAEIEALRAELLELRRQLDATDTAEEIDPALVATAENSPDFVTLVDLEGHIRYVNRVWPIHTMEEVLGSSVYDHVEPRFHAAMRQTFEQVAAQREPGRYEAEVQHPEHGSTFFESRVGAVVREDVVVGFSVISRNVTEQRLTQADEERFFRLSLDMLCVATFDGYFRRCNPAFTRLLGYDHEELSARPIITFVHPDDVPGTQLAFETLFAGRPVIDFENRYIHKNGEERWLSWRAITDDQEIIAVARDVTEHKLLEAQLRQSQKMEAVGQLAGGIAHDFNNLVLAIQANTHFALEHLSENEPIRENLEQILRATARASDLTRQVLAFGRSEPTQEIPFDLRVATQDALVLIRRLLPPETELDVQMCGETAPVIQGDPSQIEQILMNLCLNARDAMPDGGRLEVAIWSEPDPENPEQGLAAVSVTDNGEGISPHVRERLFEPFFTTKEPGRGTGLGLATVYAIVRQHGGRIDVQSELGRGSRFEIRFPMLIDEAPLETSSADSVTDGRGTETLLVAEDDELVRRVLRKILAGAGYQLWVAEDGRAALELFEAHRDDVALVLLDHIMPGMTGLEVLQKIREAGSDVPVLLSSGFRREDDTAEEMHHQPNGFLEKPYQPPSLLGAVRGLLDEDARARRDGDSN